MRSPSAEQLKAMAKRGYVPAKDAAEALGVAMLTIHRYVEDGTLAGHRMGRRLYVAQKSVAALLPKTK